MKNEVINNIKNKDNYIFLKEKNKLLKIPKLYQKKRVFFISKSINTQRKSLIKEHKIYKKLFREKKLLKVNNYINLYNKSNTINYNLFKNNTLNKSNINTINTTLNNSNSNIILNNTNNNSINNTNNNNNNFNNTINNSEKNIINKNFFNSKARKNTFNDDNNNSIQKKKIGKIEDKKNDNFNDSGEDIDINDETEEKMPVHISNYNGGLKGNRDWGLSKTDTKFDKLLNKDKIKRDIHSCYHKNNNINLKIKILLNNCEDIKKRLLYDEKNKINKINNKEINLKNNTNSKNNNNNNNLNSKILFSPNINHLNRFKKLNFDQPFRYINFSNSNKDINKNKENNRINKVPKLTIDLTKKDFDFDHKLKKFNYQLSGRDIKKDNKGLIFMNSVEKINKYNKTEYNNFINEKIKKGLLSPRDNSLYNKRLLNKFNQIEKNLQSNRIYNNNKLMNLYLLKKNNKNIKKCNKLIHHININLNNFNNISKINLNNFIFDKRNIKFKFYIENFLDIKSLIILSSLNKNFYKRFRYIIYNKYYENIILNKNKKECIKHIIKSVLKYSSDKLKNLSKEGIKQIFNSFNYKSIYNEHIIKDLTRTFPDDITFNKNSLRYYKLYNILNTYSNFNKQIGYTQGLNFICAIGLTLFDKEEEVFVFLDGLINRFDLDIYMGINNKNLVKNLDYFSKLLKKYVPDIISFFDSKLLNHEFFTTNWILTLFSNCMNRNCLVIIWCFMIVFGWKFFYCFVIELLKFYIDDILKTNENALNYKMKQLLNNDTFEHNLNMIIKNTLKLMKNCISL